MPFISLNERYPVKCVAFIRDPDQNKLIRNKRHHNAFYFAKRTLSRKMRSIYTGSRSKQDSSI